MVANAGIGRSRRHFLASTGLAATAALLAPHRLLAESDRARADPVQVHGLVEAARQKEGAGATITVRPLRGNISVLMGSGGISPSSQAATENFSSTLVLRVHAPRSPTLSPGLVPIRSSTSSTPTGTLT